MRLVLKTHSRRDIDNPNPICTTASQISLAWIATLLPIEQPRRLPQVIETETTMDRTWEPRGPICRLGVKISTLPSNPRQEWVFGRGCLCATRGRCVWVLLKTRPLIDAPAKTPSWRCRCYLEERPERRLTVNYVLRSANGGTHAYGVPRRRSHSPSKMQPTLSEGITDGLHEDV